MGVEPGHDDVELGRGVCNEGGRRVGVERLAPAADAQAPLVSAAPSTEFSLSRKFVDETLAKHKTIDAAVLTVGGFAMGKVAETKTSDIAKQYKLNFETAYNVARPVFVQMLKQNSGRIFIIGSKPGFDARNGKGMVAYGLAKSLIFRLAELMNDEAKGKNVVTSVVVPSTIDTQPNRKAMPDANFDNWVKPEAIADVIHWHCTNQAAVLRESILKVYNYA
jgi:NAD(P)-dependent dehydrogenase (short-subunit alcohol dehydrogenase family)